MPRVISFHLKYVMVSWVKRFEAMKAGKLTIWPKFSPNLQGYRDRYDIIEHGHEKSTFMRFFHRPIFTEIREFAAIVLSMLAVFICLGRLS